MRVSEFVNELKSELSEYDNAKIIDEISMYKWVIRGLKSLGRLVTEKQDTIVHVSNYKAILPENFFSVDFLGMCNFKDEVDEELDKDAVPQRVLQWVETTSDHLLYNSCNPCCYEEDSKLVTEKIYLNDKIKTFRYNNIQPIRIKKHISSNACTNNCRKLFFTESEFEVSISRQTLHANFKEGELYMVYYGSPIEDGQFIIPDLESDVLEEYLENKVKAKFFEKMMTNKESENIQSLFQYYKTQEELLLTRTKGFIKSTELTPSSYNKLANRNKEIYNSFYPY